MEVFFWGGWTKKGRCGIDMTEPSASPCLLLKRLQMISVLRSKAKFWKPVTGSSLIHFQVVAVAAPPRGLDRKGGERVEEVAQGGCGW